MKHFLNSLFLLCVFCCQAYAQDIQITDPALRSVIRETLELTDDTVITQQHLQSLVELKAWAAGVRDLSGLEHATGLEVLSLQMSFISDLSPIAELVHLRAVFLGGNKITDVTPLQGLINLEVLHLWANQITDYTPLANLINLKELRLENNPGYDISPLAHLNIDRFNYQAYCEVSRSPIAPRVENREYPSVFAAWANIINMPTLSDEERLAHHDLYFCCDDVPLRLYSVDTQQRGIQLVGNIDAEKNRLESLRAQNPNLVLLVGIRFMVAGIDAYPENWQHWLKDENGKRVIDPSWGLALLDFTQPETQEWVIAHAVAVAQCGLYDGVFLDHWSEDARLHGIRTLEAELIARDNILRSIREAVGDNFLILVNSNRSKIPRSAPYVNGTFMETLPDKTVGFNAYQGAGYTSEGLKQIESTLSWAEVNLREPRINGLEGWGLIEEPPDAPRNQQWMRLFTTMSLTHSDGYVLYTIGSGSLEHEHPWDNEFLQSTWGHANNAPHVHDHDHYWYGFYDAPLGTPIGEKSQVYENQDGLFIREFTNGWAVYNRSGMAQEIELPQEVSGWSSGVKDKRRHTLADLDGEIYIRVAIAYDVNGDGVVNILDLVIVANALGVSDPQSDVNNDGIVNILDLVVIANNFGE